MAYKRLSANLAAVIATADKKELINRDSRITEVVILSFGGVIRLHFGSDADYIELTGPVSFKPEGSEQRNGLFYSNPTAQAGVTCDIYASFSGGLGAEILG